MVNMNLTITFIDELEDGFRIQLRMRGKGAHLIVHRMIYEMTHV